MELAGLERFAKPAVAPDWRLTTAEILYHMPDHPGLLQTFIWQKHDLAPSFPALGQFLAFWQREIEGPLHSVRVASAALIKPAELRYAGGQFILH
ncbi:usg protein [Falsiroseomonas sp.]|uniref:usg protein n=1 Tax=Falsiroseomonas sp. TaxID=2870721 RepID=UPI002722D900|nr:Usg family protein [Falsiroseomonas sp.]MDO9502349.1 Usg family protein [Falsiroseomonas sp.]